MVENLSYYAFVAIMLVCIYLMMVAQYMGNWQVVFAFSFTLFVVLITRVIVLLIKGVVQ